MAALYVIFFIVGLVVVASSFMKSKNSLPFAALFLVFILIIFSGCAVTKDKKALGRVLANPELRGAVYKIEAGNHPVITKPVYIKGDTITKYDTVNIPVNIIEYIEKECPKLNIDSLKKNFSKTVTITKVVTDTMTVPDTALYRLYEIERTENVKAQVYIEYSNKLVKELTAKAKKRMWIIVGLSLGLALLLFAGVYFITNKRLLK